MTKFCQIACLTEYFTVDSKAKSLHGLFSDHSLNNSRLLNIPQSNTIFHNKCQIQTSVLMSRAIHEAISSWLFQDLSIVKKICGDFEVLGKKKQDCLTFLLGY